MKIIFLDMDGVLNSEKFNKGEQGRSPMSFGSLQFGASQIDPKGVELLNKIVEATDAHIVISSSWRHIWSPDEIGAMLEARGFRHKDRIIDKTPNSMKGFRGDEVKAWLDMDHERRVVEPERLPVQSYVILDDSTDFHTDQQDNFVNTRFQVGLTPQDAQKAIRILNQSA